MRNLIHFVRKSVVLLGGAFSLMAVTTHAQDLPPEMMAQMRAADVVLLGEVHDNPLHHIRQAQIIAQIGPAAVVWEMLTPDQPAALSGVDLSDAEAVSQALNWETSGWPDFALYAPVFAAAQGAAHFGAMVPRAEVRQAMDMGVVAYFGADAARFGLDQPLAGDEQAEREADQQDNHCGAMPETMLPMLVDFQRLRDAALAQAIIRAQAQTRGRVVVITGNGHARADRGVPVYLQAAEPDLALVTLGQSEEGVISGTFDFVLDAPAVERPDPCLAFQ